ncbi:MAG TPA: nitroreductase family protein [Thermodesulfobacteriota bacterium]
MLRGMDISRYRKPEFDIDEIFLNRWSPRAMSGEEISEAELMSLFEAAKWAPSSFNNQPWRFLYSRRDSENWGLFFNLLAEFNPGLG